MNASEVISGKIPTRPSMANRRDKPRDRRRKIDSQRNYNDVIISILRALVGVPDGSGRRKMDSEFIVQLMALSDAEYRNKVSSFMKFFVDILKHVDAINRATRSLSRDQVLVKEYDNEVYFLSRGWDSAFVKTVRFFLSNATKLLTINRKNARAPTQRGQYRFLLSEEGGNLLVEMAGLLGLQGDNAGRLIDAVQSLVDTNRTTLITVNTIIRYMVKYQASTQLFNIVPANVESQLKNVYSINDRGTVVIRTGSRIAKERLVEQYYARIADKLRDFTTVANNTFLQQVMTLPIRATANIQRGDRSTRKVVIRPGGEETTIGDLIVQRTSLDTELIEGDIHDDDEVVEQARQSSNVPTRVEMSAQARNIRRQKKIESKSVPLQDKKIQAIAAGISACLGYVDSGKDRNLSPQDIEDNQDIKNRIKELLDDDDEILLVRRFVTDCKNRANKDVGQQAVPAATTKRTARPAGRASGR